MVTKDIVYISLFTAITAAFGLIPKIDLSIGVPFSLQTISIILAGGILGSKRGFLSMLLFICLIALGLPILTGGRGGIGVLLGATGGFIFGFAISTYFIGFLTEKFYYKLNFFSSLTINLIGSILVLYLIGVPWLSFVAKMPLEKAVTVMLPFVPFDIIKAFFATFIILKVKENYPIIKLKTK